MTAITEVRLRTLGDLSIAVDGEPKALPATQKARSLLVYLAIHPQIEFQRDVLCDVLWPDAESQRARANLSTALWSIRRSFDSAGLTDPISATRNAVRWAGALEVDLLTFEAESGAEDIEACARAAALYRGDFFSEDYSDWAIAARERAAARYETVLERLLTERADPDAARRLLAVNPYVESAYDLLIGTALASNNRESASAFARRCVERTAEIGAKPSDAFMRAHGDLLDVRAAGRSLIPPPLRTTPLIGRTREREELGQTIRERRLTTIVGPGGVGKTHLAGTVALDASGAFADGVAFADLAGVTRGAALEPVIGAAVGAEEAPRTPAEVASAIGSRALLLVLDNCEHLIDRVAEVARVIVEACPNLHVIATSRERLNIDGETAFGLAPLDPEGAAQLFALRARAAAPGLSVKPDDDVEIAAICEALDRLPLAIELAASRVASLGIAGLRGALGAPLPLLRGGKRNASGRHRSLHDLLAWSYDLLEESERSVLRAISIFAGEWSIDDAIALCANDDLASGHVTALIADLAEKSLVSVAFVDGETRYRLLESTRAFARDRLEGAREGDELRERHLEFLLRRFQELDPGLGGADALRVLASGNALMNDMRQALATALEPGGDAERAAALLVAANRFWLESPNIREMRAYCERALTVLPAGSDLMRARVSYCIAVLAHSSGDGEGRERFAEIARAGFERAGDVSGHARAWNVLGLSAIARGDARAAGRAYERSLELQRQAGEPAGVAIALMNLATITQEHELDRERSHALLREAAEIIRDHETPVNYMSILNNLAIAAALLGSFDEAMAYLDEADALARGAGNEALVGTFQLSRAEAALLCERDELGRASLAASREIMLRQPDMLALEWLDVALLLADRDDRLDDAAILFEYTELIRAERETPASPLLVLRRGAHALRLAADQERLRSAKFRASLLPRTPLDYLARVPLGVEAQP